MKILLVGTDLKYSKTPSFSRAFSALDHETELVDPEQYFDLPFWNRVYNWLARPPRYFGNQRANEVVVDRAKTFQPDLVICFKPTLIDSDTVRALKQLGAMVFASMPDSIFYRKNITKAYLESIPLYDCHFFQNKLNFEMAKKYGAQKVEYLRSTADTDIFYPVEVSEEEKRKWGADIVFIGTFNWGEKRGGWLEGLCRDGYDVKVYGNRWKRCFRCSCLRKRGQLAYRAYYGEDFSRIVNASKIVINFLRTHNKDTHNSRTFEIPTCGGFMLHERTEEAMSLFKEGEEAEFFDSQSELMEKIDYYLGNPRERKKIAKDGHKAALKSQNSLQSRAEHILDVFQSIKSL